MWYFPIKLMNARFSLLALHPALLFLPFLRQMLIRSQEMPCELFGGLFVCLFVFSWINSEFLPVSSFTGCSLRKKLNILSGFQILSFIVWHLNFPFYYSPFKKYIFFISFNDSVSVVFYFVFLMCVLNLVFPGKGISADFLKK